MPITLFAKYTSSCPYSKSATAQQRQRTDRLRFYATINQDLPSDTHAYPKTAYSTFRIFTRISPPGVVTLTSSPTERPISPLAIGESLEIFPANGSDSALPTI